VLLSDNDTFPYEGIAGENYMNQPITVASLSDAEIPDVVRLIEQQETRLYTLDPRVRAPRSSDEIEDALTHLPPATGRPLVARDRHGRVRGYVQPAVWELPQSSLLHAFLTPRNGIARLLTLPDPADEDASFVAAALLAALTSYWQEKHTSGDLIRWPSYDDRWLESALVREDFLLDSVCAYTQTPPALSGRALAPSLRIRSALPDDKEALVELFREELALHQECIPFARTSPLALDAFQKKLARLWEGADLEEGAPLVLVVERQGQIVAMAENTLVHVSPDDEPGFTPLGRYGCIDNMSVREEERGMGIGRLLAQAVFAAFAQFQLDGYILWYNPGNILADQFWPRLGFQPLWTTYQRLHAHSH
jgi:GNAT superfamily N-acetyltransferase